MKAQKKKIKEQIAQKVDKYIKKKIYKAGLMQKGERSLLEQVKYINMDNTIKNIKAEIDYKIEALKKEQAANGVKMITRHIQKMNEIMGLDEPIKIEEFSWIHDKDIDIMATLSEITRRAHKRKAAEQQKNEKKVMVIGGSGNIGIKQMQILIEEGYKKATEGLIESIFKGTGQEQASGILKIEGKLTGHVRVVKITCAECKKREL